MVWRHLRKAIFYWQIRKIIFNDKLHALK